ncbi:vacuolar protein sorting-associated protein 13A-like isoform X1 [Neodiprion fabricii]|uniref:vacuolar protein sorting-associated protein 13A-like isoform X1 n=3 Tax=Neodiprion fabricii TaxID=2872261 RepID=UPI001ED8CAC1|nr:vacuolar protein sorting-associated protein 13A-like isoform X1 [Neodiprion fabricii]XP_046422195.1 vacuolar protein sorting-associated protein 13A-like isoform X1 [Neodiprion fabricii]
MFEGAVAALLNRFLGNYVEDLDTENFNVGIFSGDAYLTDLKLKTEALYQLGLPIKIKIGLIGKISLKIPWTGLTSQPVIVSIEDIYIIAVPALGDVYDPEIEKRLIRAAKKKILEDLDEDYFLGYGITSSLLDSLVTSVINNFQITINNVHVRYEDSFTQTIPVACGLCIQSLSVTTTNNKWKPGVIATNSTSIYQLMRAESISVYLDPKAETCLPEYPTKLELAKLLSWKNVMHQALQTFSINNQDFQFLMKPFTARIKIIINKSNEVRVPRMLVDFVLQDVASQITKQQYMTFCEICRTLKRISINRPYKKYHPQSSVRENCTGWWKYAYKAIVDHSVKPYTWAHLQAHRKNYHQYKNVFKMTLLRPTDTELKLDLQKYEDMLTIVSIIIAREHAKIELKEEAPQHVSVEVCKSSLWDMVDEPEMVKFVVNHEKTYGVCKLSSPERKFIQTMGNGAEVQTNPEKLSQYIDHKYNFTLANCSLSLLNEDKEVLVITLTQFLASIETRPYASAFKISARAESFVIEGASSDNELIPLITADNILTGNMASNFLSVDFEKNSLNSYANFDISVTLEPIEIMYHEYAISEIVKFFETTDLNIQKLLHIIGCQMSSIKDTALNVVYSIPSRQKRINLKMDLKGPYIVIPQNGLVQNEGNLLLLDVGRIIVKSELQAANVQLEDATMMELEELLYDRLHISFMDGQILFCHSGDDWREAKKLCDSENHLLPKIQCNFTLSHSVKIDYRVLPRTKLNMSISSLKLNLSERKLNLLSDFLCSTPFSNLITDGEVTKSETKLGKESNKNSTVQRDDAFTFRDLERIRRIIAQSCLVTKSSNSKQKFHDTMDPSVSEMDRSVVSSEMSEEDMELWASTVELPGFDDNISPHNSIKLLLRFVIGEFYIHWEQSLIVDKPYVTLRISALCLEAAIMDYGSSIHFSVGGILLADKTNAGVTGSYLELISTNTAPEVITILYRKVRANCPDFKSHFKSTEQSLIIDIAHINIIFHRHSFLALKDCFDKTLKIQHLEEVYNYLKVDVFNNSTFWTKKPDDPPIPPGATKLSYSARLSVLQITLCDLDTSLLEMKVSGLESDCIYKANERMILRLHLRGLTVIDLSDMTLYSKIVTVDEDKVLDFKYVRHTPKLYKCSDIDARQDDIKTDGSLKVSLGQINIIFISKMIHDCENFFKPFTYLIPRTLLSSLSDSLLLNVKKLKHSAIKLNLSLNLHGPTFLFPQKKDAPSLLVFDTGILTIENFFKTEELSMQSNVNGSSSESIVIDNTLIELKSVTLSRAIMMLSGNLESQEPILEPVFIRLDLNRKIDHKTAMALGSYNQCICQCDLKGTIDVILVNIGHRDLASALSIWEDNISKIITIGTNPPLEENVLLQPIAPNVTSDDTTVRKLEAFFSQNEHPFCEISLKLLLEGLQLNLFSDTEEMLSSPVRDFNHGLCKLTIGEVTLSLDVYNDESLIMKLSVRSCLLEDVRRDDSIVIRKIIQSHSQNIGADMSNISISTPPILDFTFEQTQAGDKCINILIEETRLNLSMSFLIHIGRYIIDSIPGDPVDRGVINEGYIGDGNIMTNLSDSRGAEYESQREPTLNNYANLHVVQLEEKPGVSVSVRIRKPELLLFGDLKASNAHAVLFQAELIIESSTHDGVSSIVCSLSDVQAKSKSQAEYRKQPPHWVLRPCDIEISKTMKLPNHDIHVMASVSSVDIHLSASTVQTFTNIIQDVIYFLKSNEVDNKHVYHEFVPHNDLWSQKKVSCIPYKAYRQDSFTRILFDDSNKQCETFQLKPVSICILLEMEDTIERIPVMMAQLEIDAFLQDWNYKFHMESTMKLQASCYNINAGAWEPLIEPCMKNDNVYKPWELIFRVYQSDSYEISTCGKEIRNQKREAFTESKSKKKGLEEDEAENNNGMLFIHPDYFASSKMNKNYSFEYNDDSDSDNEGSMRTLTGTFGHLFIRDESDEETSDSDDTSGDEDEGVHISDENMDDHMMNDCSEHENGIKENHLATYMILDAKDKLNFTITPNTIHTFSTILSSILKSSSGIPIIATNAGKLTLRNDIGYASKVELLKIDEENSKIHTRLIAVANYHTADSMENTPSSPETEKFPESTSLTVVESFDGGFNDCSTSYIQKDFSFVAQTPSESVTKIYNMVTEERLQIQIEGFEDTLVYCPKRQGFKLISLQPMRYGVRHHLMVHVETNDHFHRTITISSPLQIRNETSFAIGLYYKKKLAEKMNVSIIGETLNPFDDNIRMSIIEPDEIINVPLYAAYHYQIHVQPAYIEKYQVSEAGICWKELSNNLNTAKDIYCYTKDEMNQSVFAVKVLCAKRLTIDTNSRIPNYQIRILPPLVFYSRIPVAVDIKIPEIKYDVRIEPGENITIHTLKLSNNPKITFEIRNYIGNTWTGIISISNESETKLAKMVPDNDPKNLNPFLLSIRQDWKESWAITIYAQYWIVNKTGFPLDIRETCSNMIYEIQGKEPVLFAYKNNRHRLIRLRAQQSGWSPAFGLDSVGSTGLVICKDTERKRKYEIQLHVTISELCPVLTKIVTFLPNFLVVNKTRRSLRFMEDNEEADLWNDLAGGQATPFWPYTDSMRMCIKWGNSQLVSQYFDITKIQKTVLRMDHGTAVCVDVCGGSNTPFSIIFHKYQNGDAPLRVDNLCQDLFLKINQAGMGQVALLNPYQSLLYTWDEPTKNRELIWNVYNNEGDGYNAKFTKDGYGQETVSFRTLKQSTSPTYSVSLAKKLTFGMKGSSSTSVTEDYVDYEAVSDSERSENVNKICNDEVIVYWVSFMEKHQRVLLFTQDENIFQKAKTIVEPEFSEKEIFISLSGIGLSISMQSAMIVKELAYFSITDSSAIWELYFGKRWKTLSLELSAWMEDRYQNSYQKTQLEDLIDVDFEKMHMTKPFYAKLRRSYSPGIWLHCRKSFSNIYVEGKIHRVQIDNQLHDAVFPVVLYFWPSRSLSNGVRSKKLKSCLEFAFLKQKKATFDIYKKITVIIQEFALHLHKDFIVCLLDNLIPKQVEAKASISLQLRADLSAIHTSFLHIANSVFSNQQRDIFEHLYVCPVKMQLKLLGGTGGFIPYPYKTAFTYYNFIEFIFNYNHGALFKKTADIILPQYEKHHLTSCTDNLYFDIRQSYSSKILQQFNVLILTLTVVGNPYGFNFRHSTEASHSLNMIVHEDEIADKISHGIECLLGHMTTDTTQSIVSFFEASLPHVTTYSTDRKFELPNSEIPLSILLANNSFSIGVELLMSGIIVEPTNSIHKEELKHFFKGLGKGILELTTKKNVNLNLRSGLITDAIKRAQAIGYEFVSRIRLPRYINAYLGAEPYSVHKATGMHLLNTISKGHYLDKDVYWAHAALSKEGKYIALVSLQRIFLIEKRCLWGSWNIEWVLDINTLIKPPVVVEKKLILHVNKNDTIPNSQATDWYIESEDQVTLEWLHCKIETVMILNMENSTCLDSKI